MSKPLRVLLVEDSERDAALLLLYLRRGGLDPTLRRVESEAEMKEQLEQSDWDIVISDITMPRFDALRALKLLHDRGSTLPFIVVSGGVDDEVIENLMNAGASQYLPKDQMNQIVPAIERAMQTPS